MDHRAAFPGVLLVLALVAFAPPAAAEGPCDDLTIRLQACYTAFEAAGPVAEYVLCFYNTPPSQWIRCV